MEKVQWFLKFKVNIAPPYGFCGINSRPFVQVKGALMEDLVEV
ncbi:RNA polymerase sigma C factor [Bacillus sp. SG-1]|nr:RNA polymerase sigma C factor [Bacillus sp. SG-1]